MGGLFNDDVAEDVVAPKTSAEDVLAIASQTEGKTLKLDDIDDKTMKAAKGTNQLKINLGGN